MMNTDENINIDKLRSVWQEFTVAEPKGLIKPGTSAMLDHRSKLMRQHMILAVVCGIWAVFIMPLLGIKVLVGFPWYAGVYLSLYFAVMGVFTILQYYAYKDIDMCTMSVRECLGAVLKAKTLRLRSKIVGAFMATPALGYMFWFSYHENMAMFMGCVTGAVIGLYVGILMDIRIRRRLRDMARYLQSLDSVEEE